MVIRIAFVSYAPAHQAGKLADSGCYNHVMTFPAMKSILKEKCGLNRGAFVLAGISGGPDSLTLLDLLVKNGQKTAVGHFNHRLRPEADADEEFVRETAADYGLEFIRAEGDVRGLAEAEKLTIEEAARKARYRFLFAAAVKIGAEAVAVGHTADDQVETFLMHLLRGSGLAGLSGMPWRGLLPEFDPRIPLVRPLLGMWRDEVMEYCREQGLNPVTDVSNFDAAYFRNRLRLELVPYLEEYNPRVKEILWRTTQTLQGDHSLVEGVLNDAQRDLNAGAGEGLIRWPRAVFDGMPSGVRRGLMRRMIGTLRRDARDIDFDTVERGLSFLNNPSRSNEIELALGLNLQIEGETAIIKEKGSAWIDPSWPQTGDDGIDLAVPGTVTLLNGWELRASLVEVSPGGLEGLKNAGPLACSLDAGKLALPLQVRRRRPGDRMKPHGFEGRSIKVSDIWVNLKLPRAARQGWPLLCSGGEIAWLPGYRPAGQFLLDSGTRQAVKLKLVKTG